MTILDSSVWIARFDRNDSQYTRAVSLMKELEGSVTLTVPEYVIIEVCTVLTQKCGRSAAVEFLAMLDETQDVQVLLSDGDFFEGTKQVFKRQSSHALSFTDTALLYLSRRYHVVTFDRALQKALQAG